MDGFTPFPRAIPARSRTIAAALLLAALPAAASAAIITSKSFFAALPTTTINFDLTGAGAPVNLIDGQSLTMPTAEYQAQGVLFQSPILWVNDGTTAFDVAQLTGGSPDISIPSASISSFTILFTTPVRSVALFVANNHIIDPAGPSFIARDAQNNILQSMAFGSQSSASPFVAARFQFVDFGFMGFTSDTPIASLTINKQAAIFDDLTFSALVPAPASILPFTLAAAFASRRRRR